MSAITRNTLIAVFRDRATAQAAVEDLRSNGFSDTEIFSTSDSAAATSTTGTTTTGTGTHHHHEGGIVGWFKSLFGEDEDYRTGEYRTNDYERSFQQGNVAVSVHTNDEDDLERAIEILNDHSPISVNEDGATSTRDAYAASTATSTKTGKASTGESRSIPVVREELAVGKRVVDRGGVRIYSRIIEEPVEETVRLREENVRVERTPVNREATAADLRPGQEQVFEVREYREEPVVAKQARVVEEVRVGKEANERTETIRDSVRRTEVNVEDLGNASNAPVRGTSQAYETEAFDDTAYENDPAYSFGYAASRDPRYTGRSYSDVENDLRTEYSTRYPNSTWDSVKASIRRGWDKVAAKAHNA